MRTFPFWIPFAGWLWVLCGSLPAFADRLEDLERKLKDVETLESTRASAADLRNRLRTNRIGYGYTGESYGVKEGERDYERLQVRIDRLKRKIGEPIPSSKTLKQEIATLRAQAPACSSLAQTLAIRADAEAPSFVTGLQNLRQRAAGGFRSEDRYDAAWLKELLARSHSIEEVLQNLPAPLRRDHALMLRSRSSQFGSPANPRAILSNSDSSFLLTYSADPARPGFDSIELVLFDFDRAQFVPYEVKFPGGHAALTEHPQRCLACHGEPFRPIWDSYPFWPGAYGALSAGHVNYHRGATRGVEGSAFEREANALQDFNAQKASGRHRYLMGKDSLESLEEFNNGLTTNLMVLKARQLNRQLQALAPHSPALAPLTEVIRNLSEDGAAISLADRLAEPWRAKYLAKSPVLRTQVEAQLRRQRLRKLNDHMSALGLPPVPPERAYDLEQTGIADADVNAWTHRFTSQTKNDQNIQEHVKKFANLRFVVEEMLGQSLRDWNLALDPGELPTLSTGLQSGWSYVLGPPEL